jgi:P4 family phage/plasmid primase-like protien
MIQIIGLRPFTDKNGAVRMTDTFHEKGWRAESIFKLFENAEAILEQVPEDQRWNLYYTVANCTDEKRKFLRQEVIPIDIDGIAPDTEDAVVKAVCLELNLPEDKLGIVYSGNGVHILIALKTPITDASYIRNNKPYYRALCGRINTALYENGIQGKADPVVFSEARLLRMPFTENRKEGKTTRTCTLVNRNLVPLDVDLFTLADLPSIGEGEHIHPKAFDRLPKPDAEAVQSKCSFLIHCRESEEPITEPEWYAMLSIIGRLEDGDKLIHNEYGPKGKKHEKYHSKVWDEKLKHALEASGPRTCSNISLMHEGCRSCPHFNKITSPIQLISENTIRTMETGFYNIVIRDGVPSQGKPNYDDLIKYYRKTNEYFSLAENDTVFTWNGHHWQEMERAYIHAFAEQAFNPTPSNGMCLEFEAKLKRTNVKPISFTRVEGKLNFKNGVLDLETGKMEPHSTKYGFTYTIPYDYAPKGDCPTFKQFLRDISCNDDELATLIAEYMGYCLSGADPELVQKCAVLYGDGANGKSVLIHLMRELVGEDNCTSMSIGSLQKDNYRYQLMNKMFNVSGEAPNDAFMNSEIFKGIVGGDTIEVRRLYKEPVMWKCTTKLMFACNELPFTNDFSYGLSRRLLIIRFGQTFTDKKGNRDPHILKKLLAERSDIFAYCLAKFKKVAANGYNFTIPLTVEQELEDYIEDADTVAKFVVDMCKYDADFKATVSGQTIYNLFAMWCDDNNQKLISYPSFIRRFGKKIATRFPGIERTRPINGDGRRTRSYTFLRIDAVSPSQMTANF